MLSFFHYIIYFFFRRVTSTEKNSKQNRNHYINTHICLLNYHRDTHSESVRHTYTLTLPREITKICRRVQKKCKIQPWTTRGTGEFECLKTTTSQLYNNFYSFLNSLVFEPLRQKVSTTFVNWQQLVPSMSKFNVNLIGTVHWPKTV